mmetsp:Transcript_19431/g.28067  ORF Transcript_19431/g.28067 Transcript_19431/m.28067 type:complete len:264 (+) Transcript_19431:962-1753(+)
MYLHIPATRHLDVVIAHQHHLRLTTHIITKLVYRLLATMNLLTDITVLRLVITTATNRHPHPILMIIATTVDQAPLVTITAILRPIHLTMEVMRLVLHLHIVTALRTRLTMVHRPQFTKEAVITIPIPGHGQHSNHTTLIMIAISMKKNLPEVGTIPLVPIILITFLRLLITIILVLLAYMGHPHLPPVLTINPIHTILIKVTINPILIILLPILTILLPRPRSRTAFYYLMPLKKSTSRSRAHPWNPVCPLLNTPFVRVRLN